MSTVTISRAALGLPELTDDIEPLAATCFTKPQVLDLCAYRGDSGRFRVSVTEADGTTPIDVSTATWDADIRTTADEALQVGEFEVVPVAGQTNSVDVILTATVSAALNAGPYVYDLEMTIGEEVTTLLAGGLTVTKDVSRTSG